ncbi:MAG: Fe-S cluster assembly protein SufD [Dehalococcoidia bacterium]
MGQGEGQDRLETGGWKMGEASAVKVRTEGESYLSQYEAFRKGCGAESPGWLQQIQAAGISRFEANGFPTPRHEDWKYTNVAPIARARFTPAWDCTYDSPTAAQIEAFTIGGPEGCKLVFLNGTYSEELSSLPGFPRGVVVGSLAEAATLDSGPVREHLGQYADIEDNGFTALNAAFVRDGAFVYVPDGVALGQLVHLLFLSTAREEEIVSHPRNLIILGKGSRATVVGSYIGLNGGTYFTNAVTEVVVGANARFDYYKLQREGQTAFHVDTTQVLQGQESQVTSLYLDVGAALGRNNLNLDMKGDGGSCSLNGLFITGARQHIDNHTTVDHVNSYTRSRQLYKGILDGRSRAVFNGKVVARRGTHQVDAHQANRNLLLSDRAEVNTKPQLEIFADDLKCSHGATVGQLDEEAIFYMNSRGIDREEARRFLISGFARQVVDLIEAEEVRCVVEEVVTERLRNGLESLEG